MRPALKLVRKNDTTVIRLKKTDRGYFTLRTNKADVGDLYYYVMDGRGEFPDPASRHQPRGVHGPSCVTDPDGFMWSDKGWKGLPLSEYIIYELHTGTFTPGGTFESIIPRIGYLKKLGVTAIELMPVAQFPGGRNWGYDGAYPFAPQNTYGGPSGFKSLINECHTQGIAVILDVVYNHLGPEGNYFSNFGPYFTDRYRTPWGAAINYDGPYSDEVRKFFIQNALYWVSEYHIDALRIDAIHGIFDFGANHILKEIKEAVSDFAGYSGRHIHVFAESDLNDVRTITPVSLGGHGLDAQWNDDFHHSLHTLITGERDGYYADFGRMENLVKAYTDGFVYSWRYSGFRNRMHGSDSSPRPAEQFVVFAQNHDQVGNRMLGDRLGISVTFEKLKLAAGVVLLSPYIPLVFMGEEYAEKSPFCYFISHTDDWLIEAVRKGRREEFASFKWGDEMPDPQAETTFESCKIDLDLAGRGRHAKLLALYKRLISIRKSIPALKNLSKMDLKIRAIGKSILSVTRSFEKDEVVCFFNFSPKVSTKGLTLPKGDWTLVLNSSAGVYGGPGNASAKTGISPIRVMPNSFVVYRRR